MKRIFSAPLLLALSLFVVLSGCESQVEYSEEEISVQAKNAVDVLPPDPSFVGMMNIKDLSSSELGSMVEDEMQNMDELQDLIEATGFNPEEDLKEVYVAVEDFGSERNPGVSVVAYASLDPNRLEGYVEERAGDDLQRRSYRGIDLYEFEADDHMGGFSFVNEDMILMASKTGLLEDMVDRLIDEGEALSWNSEMMELVSTASTGKSGWFVAEKPEMDAPVQNDAGNEMDERAKQIFMAVNHVIVAANVDGDEVESQVFLEPNSSVDAGDLADLVKGLRSALRADPGMAKQDLDMLDEIKISSSRGQVRIQFTVDDRILGKFNG